MCNWIKVIVSNVKRLIKKNMKTFSGKTTIVHIYQKTTLLRLSYDTHFTNTVNKKHLDRKMKIKTYQTIICL